MLRNNVSQSSYSDWYRILKSKEGPAVLSDRGELDFVVAGDIVRIGILAGSRKAAFIAAYLRKNIIPGDNVIETDIYEAEWNEDSYKNLYQMSGISPALKVGVAPRMEKDGDVRVATDVTVKIDGKQVHRNLKSDVEEIKEQLVEHFSQSRTIGVKSQVAGLIRANGDLHGVVVNPSRGFTTTRISPDEVVKYVSSLDETALRRSPGSILWPHPVIEKHIIAIGGIERSSDIFSRAYVDLLQHLLGAPVALSLVIDNLNQRSIKGADENVNLYSKLRLAERGLINEGKTLEGSWQELVRDDYGDWITLRNANEDDYEQMSQIAINNFKYAPNYSYLQTPEGREQQEKYITANSPDGIRDLCSKTNNVCNLVLEKDGKILGYRVVRKEEDVADGRRMHTSLGETGRGIGRILLRKSEKIAKQAGCKTMEVHATGNSHSWFEKYGFKNFGIRPNTISDYHLMVKEL